VLRAVTVNLWRISDERAAAAPLPLRAPGEQAPSCSLPHKERLMSLTTAVVLFSILDALVLAGLAALFSVPFRLNQLQQ
jgi:hypothetical protein